MLINFTLVPVEQVQPWGTPGNLSLSWFGLTDGLYWIKAGSATLFEYSDYARSAGVSRYCDYQVVRLYEDLVEMLPYILEPVPNSLVQYLSGETANSWQETYSAWCEKDHDVLGQERFYEIIDAAVTWTGKRRLDSAYLSPSANIIIWSDKEDFHIEWDNRSKKFNGKPAWSAVFGSYQMPRSQFVEEMQSFHFRLMEQMSVRVQQVVAGILAPDINIDLPRLVQEHEERARTLDGAFECYPQTDWCETERAIREILSI